jgi:hypothetical protein
MNNKLNCALFIFSAELTVSAQESAATGAPGSSETESVSGFGKISVSTFT